MMRGTRPDAAIYDRAAEILQERGLNKHNFYNPERGSVCAYGALHLAVAERKRLKGDVFIPDEYEDDGSLVPVEAAYVEIPEAVLGSLGFAYPFEISLWNDRRSTRKGQVVAKLRQMAEAERSLR